MGMLLGYINNSYSKIRIAGNYLIGAKSSTPTQFKVTLENSSGTTLATLFEKAFTNATSDHNGGSEYNSKTETNNFDSTFDISGIKGQFRVKVYIYERYTDTTDNYINFTTMTLQ